MNKYCPLFLSLIFATLSLHAAEPETGEARVDRLLAAMGGREAWARTKSVIVEATHYNLTAPTTYSNRIVNDFTRPRVLFEAHAPDWDRWSSIEGKRGTYRRNQEAVTALSAERVASELDWWKANFYRTLHRLAIRDPNLTLHAEGNDRLEIHDKGERLNWFRLNADGSPVLYGAGENSAATIMGPLKTASNGVRYPQWGAGDLGAWRYQIEKFVPNPALSVREFTIPSP